MKGIFLIPLFATMIMVEPILGFTGRMAVGGSSHMKARARMQGASSHNGFANRKTTTSLSAANSPLFSSSAASIVETVSNPFLNPVKQGLVALRGGAAGAGIVAVRYATRFLDDVAASKTKSWMALVVAILLETTASTLSKRARDTANPSLFAVSVCLNIMSLCGFCTCLAKLDVGIAYAVWAALGTVIVTTAGIFLFGEAANPMKLASILLVILGVIGLNLAEGN